MEFDITSLLSKDKMVAKAIRALLDAELDGLATVREIDFKSSTKSLIVTLDMSGEPHPRPVFPNPKSRKPKRHSRKWG